MIDKSKEAGSNTLLNYDAIIVTLTSDVFQNLQKAYGMIYVIWQFCHKFSN